MNRTNIIIKAILIDWKGKMDFRKLIAGKISKEEHDKRCQEGIDKLDELQKIVDENGIN